MLHDLYRTIKTDEGMVHGPMGEGPLSPIRGLYPVADLYDSCLIFNDLDSSTIEVEMNAKWPVQY